jgi:hypothetical protein
MRAVTIPHSASQTSHTGPATKKDGLQTHSPGVETPAALPRSIRGNSLHCGRKQSTAANPTPERQLGLKNSGLFYAKVGDDLQGEIQLYFLA